LFIFHNNLPCRDNELLDLYNLDTATCVTSLKHESKVLHATKTTFCLQVLCATIHEGRIVVGCQYGLLVFWDLAVVLGLGRRVVGQHHAIMVLYEHSAAISNIHVDDSELITDDYDGIVILRSVATTTQSTN
jgi:hypothetical protein